MSIRLSDTFLRPDGTLGGSWGPVGSCTDNSTANPGPYTGGIQLKNHAFAPVGNGTDVGLCAFTGVSVGNDQWASASIAAIAPFTSVVNITACTSSAGTSTYTYTLTSGAALIVNQQIYITGMTNAGNNSPTAGFNITGLGAGTFNVSNATPGANESGSNGTGTSPSDSVCGPAVRVSADGKTGYAIEVGTNSGKVAGNGVSVDHRVYCVELWKFVNGIGTVVALYQSGLLTTIPDSVGDVYALSAFGTRLTVSKNGVTLLSATDASIASGTPGICTWSIGGAGEFSNPTNYQGNIGNSGTQWTNWQAGDSVVTYSLNQQDSLTEFPFINDSIPYANGDLHTANASWVYEGSSAFTVSTNKVFYSTVAQVPGFAYRSDATPGNDQWSQCTMVIAGTGATQNCGPAVRVSASQATGYYVQCANNLFALSKIVNGTPTQLGTSGTFPTTGGKVTLMVTGSTLRVFLNGVKQIEVTDTDITSGNVGIMGAGNSLTNGVSAIAGGTVITSANGAPLDPVGVACFVYRTGAAGLTNLASTNPTLFTIAATGTYKSDHYSQGTFTTATAPATLAGVAVRVDKVNNTGYVLSNINNTVSLHKFTGTTLTLLNSLAHTWVQNEVYRLEAQGPLLLGKINGTTVLATVDTTYATGVPGISMNLWTGGSSWTDISTWFGGNIDTSSPVISSGIGDAPMISSILPVLKARILMAKAARLRKERLTP